jgi:hypothetical protein
MDRRKGALKVVSLAGRRVDETADELVDKRAD